MNDISELVTKYQEQKTWHARVLIIELYHLSKTKQIEGWTITDTAKTFNISRGLVSENLKLARAIHEDSTILECPHRQAALDRL